MLCRCAGPASNPKHILLAQASRRMFNACKRAGARLCFVHQPPHGALVNVGMLLHSSCWTAAYLCTSEDDAQSELFEEDDEAWHAGEAAQLGDAGAVVWQRRL